MHFVNSKFSNKLRLVISDWIDALHNTSMKSYKLSEIIIRLNYEDLDIDEKIRLCKAYACSIRRSILNELLSNHLATANNMIDFMISSHDYNQDHAANCRDAMEEFLVNALNEKVAEEFFIEANYMIDMQRLAEQEEEEELQGKMKGFLSYHQYYLNQIGMQNHRG